MIKGERHGLLVFLEDLGLDEDHNSIGRFACDCGTMCVKHLARVKSGTRKAVDVYYGPARPCKAILANCEKARSRSVSIYDRCKAKYEGFSFRA
jgi:hypothetical protein